MDFSFGRDLALIWLSLFCLIGLLVPIVALFFAVRYMNIGHQKIVQVIQQSQGYLHTVRQKTEQVSQSAVRPVVSARANLTKASITMQSITGRKAR